MSAPAAHSRLARYVLSTRSSTIPRRHEYTEKTLLSRLSPYPLPEDAVVVVRLARDPAAAASLALLKRGFTRPKGGEIVSSSSSSAASAPPPAPGAAKKLPMTQDILEDAVQAARDAIAASQGSTVYLKERLGAGVAAESRVGVSVVTDCAHTSRFLDVMLARMPTSAAPPSRVRLSHSRLPDESSKNLPYVGFSEQALGVVARGPVPLPLLLDAVAQLSARVNEPKQVLTLKCDARSDKAGATTLVFGAPSTEASSSAGELVAAHHVAWSEARGVTRMWDGVASAGDGKGAKVQPDLAVAALRSAATFLNQPARLSFVLDPQAKKAKPIDAARARTLLAEKFLVSGGTPAEEQLKVVDKLLAASKPEMLVYE
jgi:hypothetical protein